MKIERIELITNHGNKDVGFSRCVSFWLRMSNEKVHHGIIYDYDDFDSKFNMLANGANEIYELKDKIPIATELKSLTDLCFNGLKGCKDTIRIHGEYKKVCVNPHLKNPVCCPGEDHPELKEITDIIWTDAVKKFYNCSTIGEITWQTIK